jgi:hypothetical protein
LQQSKQMVSEWGGEMYFVCLRGFGLQSTDYTIHEDEYRIVSPLRWSFHF